MLSLCSWIPFLLALCTQISWKYLLLQFVRASFFLYQKSPHKNKADGHADITCCCDQVDVFRSPMSSLVGWDRKVNLTRVTAALQHLVDTRLIGTTCVASLAAAVLSSIISFLTWASLCFTTECGRIVVQFGPSPGISHVATDQGTHGVLSCE